MTNTAPQKTNTKDDLGIIFECNGYIFTNSLIYDFIYENELNTRPKGSFILKDDGTLGEVGLPSGSFGFIYFTNTKDGVEEKSMSLPIYIDDVENFERVNQFFRYKIKWSAGNLNQLHINQGDVVKQSNSVDAIRKILEVRNSNVMPFQGSPKPTDNMNWLVVNKDMWKQLGSIVDRSFLSNDYIFWAWDDVNNRFNISSILTEFTKKDSYLFIRDINTISTTTDSIQIIGSNELTIWRYDTFKKFSILGSRYKKLFPNVSFLGIPNTEIRSVAIRQQNFVNLLKSLKDTKLNDVLKETKLSEDNATFGDLQIRKQNLNGHDLYSFSDIYRDYKYSTYSKMFMVKIHNTVGPPIGSYVSIYNINNTNSVSGNVEIDKRFSDRYIIVKKIIEYKGKTLSANGKEILSATNVVTTIFLASDNYNDGIDYVSPLIARINKVD